MLLRLPALRRPAIGVGLLVVSSLSLVACSGASDAPSSELAERTNAAEMTGLGAAPANACPSSPWFEAYLSSRSVVPPVATSGRGFAHFYFDCAERRLTGTFDYWATEAYAVQASINVGGDGETGPALKWFDVRSDAVGRAIDLVLTEEQARLLRRGGLYLEVGTMAHLPAEIRGQILPPRD